MASQSAIAAPRERPILFSGPMVRAILEGRKTQTRRIIKEAPVSEAVRAISGSDYHWMPPGRGIDHWRPAGPVWAVASLMKNRVAELRCPYGAPGDRLWVRETHALVEPSKSGALEYEGARLVRPYDDYAAEVWYRADGELGMASYLWDDGPRWRPSIYMPRWASRITLEVTGVRVERLCGISKADARAEGVTLPIDGDGMPCGSPVTAFAELWESINGEGSWHANPWVWVVEFRRVP